MTTIDLEAAAAPAVGEAGLACGNLDELMGCLAPCFARVEPRRQARKYIVGLMGDLPCKNCWALAEQAGDQTPDKMERLLERAAWDAGEAMAVPGGEVHVCQPAAEAARRAPHAITPLTRNDVSRRSSA